MAKRGPQVRQQSVSVGDLPRYREIRVYVEHQQAPFVHEHCSYVVGTQSSGKEVIQIFEVGENPVVSHLYPMDHVLRCSLYPSKVELATASEASAVKRVA